MIAYNYLKSSQTASWIQMSVKQKLGQLVFHIFWWCENHGTGWWKVARSIDFEGQLTACCRVSPFCCHLGSWPQTASTCGVELKNTQVHWTHYRLSPKLDDSKPQWKKTGSCGGQTATAHIPMFRAEQNMVESAERVHSCMHLLMKIFSIILSV